MGEIVSVQRRPVTTADREVPAQAGLHPADRLARAEREVAGLRAAAAESGEWLRAIEELAGVASWSWDIGTTEVRWSPTMFRILGVDGADVTPNWPWFMTRVHPDDRDGLAQVVRDAVSTGTPYSAEYRIVRPSGVVRDIRALGRVETDGAGRTVRLAGTVQDVSRERSAARALRRSRDLFAGVLDAATEQAIIATDLSGVVSVFNTGAERMLGWSAAERVGETTERLHDTAEMAAVAVELGIETGLPAFLRRMAERTPETRRFTYLTRAGDRRQVLLTVTAMRDLAGRATGYIKIATDVTDQVLAQAVLDSETRFRNTFEYAPNGMMLIDLGVRRAGRLIQVNPALCRLTGHGRDALLDMDVTDLTSPEHRDDLGRHFIEIRAGRQGAVSLEQRWVAADGTDLWVQFNMSPRASDRDHYVVAQVEDITARKYAEERLTHQALHDGLTGLPNRLLLMDRMTHALAAAHRSRRGVGVLYLDLDGFKAINDSAGHAAGDQALRQVADRLRHSLRPGDTVARLGGDEFVAVCPDIDTVDTVVAIAQRVARELRRPIGLAAQDFVVGASIGISLSTDDSTPEQLLHDADRAMYGAKNEGKDRIRVGAGHDPELTSRTARAVRGMRIEAELVRAVDRHELVLFGQPVIDLASGAVVAVETLMRWQHPERGLLPPSEFLDVAENGALIGPVGRRALNESCRMAAVWSSVLGGDAPAVHVNVSGRQLESGHLHDEVMASVDRWSLPPDRLVLELTETHMPLLADSLRRDVQRMRQCGVRIAIDDLGTGYSSLTRITELPVDLLKIDLTFVQGMSTDPACAAVVRGVLAIGAALGLDVIAEGVETAEQAEQLRAWGCSGVQGYLYGRPMPEEALRHRLGVG